VPPGFGPGSTFTVEFASEEEASPATAPTAFAAATPTPPDNRPDDGFATGFGNPAYRPPATAVPAHEVNVSNYEQDINVGSSYPTTSATPVYDSAYNPDYRK